jgi:hypothetical protein
MKTQEEYAREIEGIILRDVESCQGDWFNIDKEIFMQPENKNKAFILGTQGFYRCNDAGTLPGECADFIFHKCND